MGRLAADRRVAGEVPRSRPLAFELMLGLGLFLAWMLSTWALEGRLRTALRPDAIAEGLTYALLANLALGVVGGGLLMRRLRRAGVPLEDMGVQAPRRTIVAVPAGLLLGLGGLFVVDLPTDDPIILLNAFARVTTVAAAEVVICWAVLGATLEALTERRGTLASLLVHLGASSVAYGAYNAAHSPPWGEPIQLVVLAVIGLLTGLFFLRSRDLYGTVLFHALLGVHGAVWAVYEAGHLGSWSAPQVSEWVVAALGLAALVAVDRWLVRPQAASDAG